MEKYFDGTHALTRHLQLSVSGGTHKLLEGYGDETCSEGMKHLGRQRRVCFILVRNRFLV